MLVCNRTGSFLFRLLLALITLFYYYIFEFFFFDYFCKICIFIQGAMAVEVRSDDKYTSNLLGQLSDIPSLLICLAERTFMRVLVRILKIQLYSFTAGS